ESSTTSCLITASSCHGHKVPSSIKDRCRLSEPFATERWKKAMAHYMLQVKYTLKAISQIAVSGDTRQEAVRPYHRVVAARHMHWMFQSSV
ncbi:uncharacterized protein METZ01_LOCUS342035, partial [marine metagenome]